MIRWLATGMLLTYMAMLAAAAFPPEMDGTSLGKYSREVERLLSKANLTPGVAVFTDPLTVPTTQRKGICMTVKAIAPDGSESEIYRHAGCEASRFRPFVDLFDFNLLRLMMLAVVQTEPERELSLASTVDYFCHRGAKGLSPSRVHVEVDLISWDAVADQDILRPVVLVTRGCS